MACLESSGVGIQALGLGVWGVPGFGFGIEGLGGAGFDFGFQARNLVPRVKV